MSDSQADNPLFDYLRDPNGNFGWADASELGRIEATQTGTLSPQGNTETAIEREHREIAFNLTKNQNQG
jgi:hypothetical protein